MPAPVFRSKNSTGGAATTSVNATQPADTAVGDLLLCTNLVHGADVTFTMSGWTLLQELVVDGPSYDFNVAWFWLIAARAGTQNHAVSWGGASRYNGTTIIAIQAESFDASNPIAASAFAGNAAATRTIAFPAVRPALGDCLDVLCGVYDEGATITVPVGYVQRADDFGPFVATSALAGAGDTGTVAATSSLSLPSAGGRIAVAPAVVTRRLCALGAG